MSDGTLVFLWSVIALQAYTLIWVLLRTYQIGTEIRQRKRQTEAARRQMELIFEVLE